MSHLDIVPLGELGRAEVKEVAQAVHIMVTEPNTREMLLARNLLGVVARHSTSYEESLTSLRQAKRADPTELRPFVVMDRIQTNGDRREAIGMATIQPNLPLWRQRLPLPTKLTRNPLLGERQDSHGANVSAWIDYSPDEGVNYRGRLQQAFRFLSELAGESWTLVPHEENRVVQLTSIALRSAGYVSTNTVQRYDEYETRGPAPKSTLWLAKPKA